MNTLQSIVEQLNADYKQKVDAARAEYDAKRHELKEAKKAAIQASMSAVEPANPSPDKKRQRKGYGIQKVVKGSVQGWLKDSELYDADGVVAQFKVFDKGTAVLVYIPHTKADRMDIKETENGAWCFVEQENK